MNWTNKTYKALPFYVRNMLRYIYSMMPLRKRLGNEFYRQLAFLESSQWWSEDQLASYQNTELKKLIRHAYDNVPFYGELFRSRGLIPDDIQTTDDLYKIPILTKDDVRNNLETLRARNFKDRDIMIYSTSGTTGMPTAFYCEKKKHYLNYDPFMWRFFGWAGHQPGQRRATLSSWTTAQKTYVYNPVRNLLILSAYNLNADCVEQYADALKKYRITYLDGYPAMIELLTNLFKENNIPCPVHLSAVLTHSEYLSDWQRETIQDYWNCPCFNRYSMEESVVLGIECEKHEGLHLCSDFGITEFLDSGMTECKRIVATGFNNYAMPFIRYETEDMGQLLEKKCSCGRNFPLFMIYGGRTKNFAVAKDGSYISVTNIDIPNVTDHIRQFQFIQNVKGSMILTIVKKEAFCEADMLKVRAKLKEKFGNNMEIEIVLSDNIHQTRSSKTPIFIQNIQSGMNV